MWKKIFVFILIFQKCCSVIYHLNESEYDRMPALYGLDPYERCLRDQGLYCLLRLDLYGGSNIDLMSMIQEYSELTTKHYNHTYIERGVCVTETCKKYYNQSFQNLSSVLGGCMNDSIHNEYGIEAKLSHVYYCDEEVGQKADSLDWIVAVLFGGLAMAVVVGSVYDVVFNRKRAEENHWTENQYLFSFSVLKNWEGLMKPSNEGSENTFKVFYGYKCIGTFFVILVHVMLTAGSGFVANPHNFEKGYETTFYQLIFNSMVMVQVFFLMTGFLLAYHLQKSAESMDYSWAMIPKIVFIRWCRLTPAYAAMLAFNTTWLRHLGSGPVWNLFVGGAVADCRKYWWAHLLYFQNYVADDKFCAMHTWHLAADLQLVIVGLIVYMMIMAKRRLLVLMALIGLGMLAPALHVLFQDLDPVTLMTPETYRTVQNDTFSLVHIRGHNYFPCFFIGMVAGYLVHSWQKKGIYLLNNKVIRFACWCVIPCIITLMLTGRGFYADGPRASLGTRALYAATHRPALGLLLAFGTITFIMKWEDKLRSIFEWDGWLVPSRLSYSVFLLHMNVVHVLLGAKQQLTHVSTLTLIINQLGVLLLSYILALPFYLLVESPMSRILKIFVVRENIQRTKKIH